MRKTFDVNALRLQVNGFLHNSYDLDEQQRQGQISLLESVLMGAGQYKGFGYLSARDMESSREGMSVGIGGQRPDLSFDFTDTDSTRVFYY